MQDLIRRLSRDNPLWGAERICDTLLLLDHDAPHEDTIRKYIIRRRKPWQQSVTRQPFLRNHLDASWAIGFFTVTTMNLPTLYVFLVFDHGRRKVIHVATTYCPSQTFIVVGREPRNSEADGLSREDRRIPKPTDGESRSREPKEDQ